MEINHYGHPAAGKKLVIGEEHPVISLEQPSIPLMYIVSRDRGDLYAVSMVDAFNNTWGSGIDPAAVPELLRRFKICASMLGEYMAENYDAPQSDYNALEGFEDMINAAEVSGGVLFSAQPLQFQLASVVNDCHARIENGAEISDAFSWLEDEIIEIFTEKERNLRSGR